MADVEDSAGSESEEEDELEKNGSRKLTNDSRTCMYVVGNSPEEDLIAALLPMKTGEGFEGSCVGEEGMAPFSHVLISGARSAKFKP